MDIREYRPADRDACAAITGEAGWAAPPGLLFVAEHEGRVIGCGGYRIDEAGAALLGPAIQADFRRMGVGRFLAMYCLRHATRGREVRMIGVRSRDQDCGFFEKLGFRTTGGSGGVAEMVKKLEVCA